MENEIWKPIPGHEEYYEVSNLGRVRRIKSSAGAKAGRILKGYLDSIGYLGVTLSINGKVRGFFIHRLVAMTFIPNPENKREVNHKDGNKTNNSVSNLEWATRSENVMHAYNTGLIDKEKISATLKGRPRSEEHIRKLYEANKGRIYTEEARKKMSEALKGHKVSEETRRKMSEAKKGSVFINNGTKCFRVRAENLQEYLDKGYVLGICKRT